MRQRLKTGKTARFVTDEEEIAKVGDLIQKRLQDGGYEVECQVGESFLHLAVILAKCPRWELEMEYRNASLDIEAALRFALEGQGS